MGDNDIATAVAEEIRDKIVNDYPLNLTRIGSTGWALVVVGSEDVFFTHVTDTDIEISILRNPAAVVFSILHAENNATMKALRYLRERGVKISPSGWMQGTRRIRRIDL